MQLDMGLMQIKEIAMREITGNTRLFGIVADPIGHVQTPQAINQIFAEQGYDGVMVPFHVKPEGLEAFIDSARKMENLGGLIITVPHKIRVLELCDTSTEAARMIGAANTLRPASRIHAIVTPHQGGNEAEDRAFDQT